MNKKGQKFAFTLIELIVVITILAILWTISFVSLDWYSKSARDSKRITDVNTIKKSLELFQIKTSFYPIPDNWKKVFYNDELLRKQWTIWNNVMKNLSKNLSKKPIDPTYEIEYLYSITNDKREYQILSIFEKSLSYNSIIKNSYAKKWYFVRLDWNYNWVFVKTSKHIIPTPSIINSEIKLNETKLNSQNIKSQIVDWGKNFPDLKIDKNFWTWWLDLKLWVWDIIYSNSSDDEKLEIFDLLKKTYTWTEIWNKNIYKKILNLSSREEKIKFINNFILKTKKKWFFCEKWFIEKWWVCVPNWCLWKIPVHWEKTATQEWISWTWHYSETPWLCTFVCKKNYTQKWENDCTDQQAPVWWNFTMTTNSESKIVTLNIVCPTDVIDWNNVFVAYWNYSNPVNWESCKKSISHTLTSWNWAKNVYVRFKDTSNNFTNSIIRSVSFLNPCWTDIILKETRRNKRKWMRSYNWDYCYETWRRDCRWDWFNWSKWFRFWWEMKVFSRWDINGENCWTNVPLSIHNWDSRPTNWQTKSYILHSGYSGKNWWELIVKNCWSYYVNKIKDKASIWSFGSRWVACWE